MSGIYVHVPFCRSRCIYCDFYSTTHSQAWQLRYVEALEREMQARCGELSTTRVHTIYIGGGTPSQLQPSLLQRLFSSLAGCFPLDALEEVTIEANPDDVTPRWLDALATTPVNRISMGVQTFDDALLGFLRRRHTAEQALQAVHLCREWGYTNLSLDLIYGLPGQTLDGWQRDVQTLLRLRTPHISAYALSYEEGTPLMRLLQRGQVQETPDEVQWQMYEHLLDATTAAGMEHYEISNFALPDFHSRHNSSYWNGTPYLGLGPGAHSYDGCRIRRANHPLLSRYCAEQEAPHSLETLTDDERYDELVLTRLRTSQGLPLSLLTSAQRAHCLRQAQSYMTEGQLLLRDDVLRLTRSGIFVSNAIISDLMA